MLTVYHAVDQKFLDQFISNTMNIWPTFIEEAEGKLMWEVLAGRVK